MPRVATKLMQAADGGWIARKRIPEDAQGAYQKLYGVRWEARFHCEAMPAVAARAKHRDWLNEVEARINNIRAERKGEGITLTDKQARALSGEWYHWFVAKHLEDPQHFSYWEHCADALDSDMSRGAYEEGDPDSPHFNVAQIFYESWEARAYARLSAGEWAETTQFLHTKRLALDKASKELFLDYVCRDLYHAFSVLYRRAKGDWSEDEHIKEFPKFEPKGSPRLTPWSLFEQWVAAKKPAPSAVERWRGVFLKLQSDFPDRSVSSITSEE